jgi:hypothetical protein
MSLSDRPESAGAIPPQVGSRRLWAWTIPAAILAGLAAWWLGETSAFRVAPEEKEFMAMGRMINFHTPQTREAAGVATATRAHAALGALLGLALGVAGGTARRSLRAALFAGLAGLLVGAVTVAATTFWGVRLYNRVRFDLPSELIASLLVHGWIWSWVGAAGGLALGFALGGRRTVVGAVVGGMLGALVGTVVYELLGAILFPIAETGQPISTTWATRLLARLLVAIAAASGATLAVWHARAT